MEAVVKSSDVEAKMMDDEVKLIEAVVKSSDVDDCTDASLSCPER